MKKIWKRTLAMLLVVVMVCGFAPIESLAEKDWPTLPDGLVSSWVNDGIGAVKSAASWFGERLQGLSLRANAENYSGSCGINASWNLDTEAGILTISGTGAMTEFRYINSPFTYTTVPWECYDEMIKTALIEDGITTIGSWAFDSCYNLTRVTIPNSVTSIGGAAFSHCRSLNSIIIPDAVTGFGEGAFAHSGITSFIIPNSVKSIGRYAFGSCIGLTSITIPNSVTSIGKEAFHSCTSLKSVTIPDGVASIGEGAFASCTSLKSVTIPDSVTNIGDGAFAACTNLVSITTEAHNPAYSSDAYGVLYNKSKTKLIQYPIGNMRTAFTIPGSVITIGKDAFSSCTSLKSVTIPDSVTNIDDWAFFNCTSLTDVYYSGSESDRRNISIDSSNKPLLNAAWHYNYASSSHRCVFESECVIRCEDCSDRFAVQKNDDNTLSILYYIGCNTDVTIPETVEGFTVNASDLDIFFIPLTDIPITTKTSMPLKRSQSRTQSRRYQRMHLESVNRCRKLIIWAVRMHGT